MIRHHALRGREDRNAEAVIDPRQVLHRHIDPAAGLGDAGNLADHRRPVEIFQLDLELVASILVLHGREAADIAFGFQHFEHAFAQTWALTGAPIPDELPKRDALPPAGDVPLRVIATIPATASLYRLDQLIAAIAQRTLWLTDAYFVGVTGYVQGLRAAVMDGVDVRLLVPGATDIPIVRAVSRAGYFMKPPKADFQTLRAFGGKPDYLYGGDDRWPRRKSAGGESGS